MCFVLIVCGVPVGWAAELLEVVLGFVYFDFCFLSFCVITLLLIWVLWLGLGGFPGFLFFRVDSTSDGVI